MKKPPWEARLSIGADQMIRESRLAEKTPAFRAAQIMITSSRQPLTFNDIVIIKK